MARRVAAAVSAAPDRADDPHGEPFVDAGVSAVVPEHAAQEMAAQVEARSPWVVEPSRTSGDAPSSETTFRTRTATLARRAVSTAHQRRAVVAALLGVALLSASVGVLAGRWLASRAAPAAGSTR